MTKGALWEWDSRASRGRYDWLFSMNRKEWECFVNTARSKVSSVRYILDCMYVCAKGCENSENYVYFPEYISGWNCTCVGWAHMVVANEWIRLATSSVGWSVWVCCVLRAVCCVATSRWKRARGGRVCVPGSGEALRPSPRSTNALSHPTTLHIEFIHWLLWELSHVSSGGGAGWSPLGHNTSWGIIPPERGIAVTSGKGHRSRGGLTGALTGGWIHRGIDRPLGGMGLWWVLHWPREALDFLLRIQGYVSTHKSLYVDTYSQWKFTKAWISMNGQTSEYVLVVCPGAVPHPALVILFAAVWQHLQRLPWWPYFAQCVPMFVSMRQSRSILRHGHVEVCSTWPAK